MVLDSKIQQLRDHFGILSPDDWSRIHPQQIVALQGIGEVTLNHLRLHLAARGLTLRDDQTPAYWQEHLADAQMGTTQVSSSDRSLICPFLVVVDTREQHPFTFSGLRSDANEGNRPLIVKTTSRTLGNSHGDYSIDGHEYECHIERKSKQDAQSTILGWGDHRSNFEKTLQFLAEIQTSAVIVECSLGEMIASVESRGKKTKTENAKIMFRQTLAWQQDYRVPWIFCDNRRLAEVACFRVLYRHWKYAAASKKKAEILAQSAELDSLI